MEGNHSSTKASRKVEDCMQYDRSSFRSRKSHQCKRNPGHKDFIPIPEFGLHHLPEKYRDKRIFDVIRVEAELTVLLRIKYTSRDRYDYDQFFPLRGTRLPRISSGWISDLMWKKCLCPCHECKVSPNPKLEWAMINILTAAHCVFDSSEARHTVVNVGADTESSQGCMSIVLGYDIVSSDFKKDRCNFVAATHDRQLCDHLKLRIKQRKEIRQRCADVVNNLVAIVSHPHGEVKHVTIGEWMERNGSMYLYRAPSCPGSSGAPVIVFDMNRLSTRNPHSGAKNGLGVSGTFESTKHEVLEEESDIDYESNIECHKYCQKNPSHVGFIPITEFNMSHLPEKHRDQRIFDVIQAEAELTVRLLVKYISNARPDGYFLAKSRGKRNRTIGSGWISGLKAKFTAVNNTKCPCRICKASDEPKMEWGMLEISTAKHVVYDSSEAEHTDVHIFTDKNKPENKHEVYGYDVRTCNEDGDYCVLLAATHDLNLWNYLQTRDEHRSEMWKKCEGLANTFAAVVSFPHGCGKYITCGEWTTRHPIGPVFYSASTCSGSSGALIIMFGGIDNDHYLTHHGISNDPMWIGRSSE